MSSRTDSAAVLDRIPLVLILSVSAVIWYGYLDRVGMPNLDLRLALHNQIVAGTAPAPYRYRILVPFAAEVFIRPLSGVLGTESAFALVYALYEFFAIGYLLSTLFVWLRSWFSRDQALIGVLFAAGTMPIALQDHQFQPWSLLEAGLFSAALLAIHNKRHGVLGAIVVLASLNRETALFIPLALLMSSLDTSKSSPTRRAVEWRAVGFSVLLVLVWAVIFLALRYCLGSAPADKTLSEIFAFNTTAEHLSRTVVNGTLFLGGYWILSVRGIRNAPDFVRRVAFTIPLYLIVIAIWGVWYEVRLFMPLYPILIASGLSYICAAERRTKGS